MGSSNLPTAQALRARQRHACSAHRHGGRVAAAVFGARGIVPGPLIALGDKRGRVSVLFGSIFMYSAANIANGFVRTVPQYAALRLIAGIGLAGELGAGITLVSEIMHRESRGYGTTIVATIGILGAVVAALQLKEPFGVVGSAIAVGVVTLAVAVVSLLALEETYGKNLDQVEE